MTFTGQDIFKASSTIRVSIPVPTAAREQEGGRRRSNNSAMDISKALVDNGIDVDDPAVLHAHRQVRSLMEIALGDLYSQRAVDSGMTTRRPISRSPHCRTASCTSSRSVYDAIREQDKEFYDGLAAAGFDLDFGDDDSGLFMKYLRRGSGYYIDVGAAS